MSGWVGRGEIGMSLLIETQDDIKQSGHTADDIVFIGSEKSGYSCTWHEFTSLANREYDSGFGPQKVATDLIVVFRDGSKMWRDEYDGSERWSYSEPFVMPKETTPIGCLFAKRVGWEDLSEINS